MFGFRSPLQEGHRGGVCYVYMYSATDGGFAFFGGLSKVVFKGLSFAFYALIVLYLEPRIRRAHIPFFDC